MLTFLLLLVMWATFPEQPLIAFLATCAAAWSARGWEYHLPDRAFSLIVWGALTVVTLTYLVT